MIRTEIADNVYLNYIPHTRFKANYLTMNFLTPLERETAALYSLVPRVLSQGCAAYPGTVALAEQLQSLYNLSLSRNRVFKRGETQVICQSAWMLDNSRYCPDEPKNVDSTDAKPFSFPSWNAPYTTPPVARVSLRSSTRQR